MTILDRTQIPAFKEIDSYNLPEANTVVLDNGIPLHLVLSGAQDAVRLELIFKAGARVEPSAGVAHFVAKMLSEGTAKHSAKAIQDKFAYYGAFPEFSSGSDMAFITVYCLSKHLEALLPLLQEILSEASFPKDALEKQKTITLQSILVSREKTSYLASSKFKELVFGATHPYGYVLAEEAIAKIEPPILQDFYAKNYTIGNCEIIISGGTGVDFQKILNKTLGKTNWEKPDATPFTEKDSPSITFTKKTMVEKAGAIQSSIRMGKKLFTISHPDYYAFYFLNEVFGGYFGSRLMQNIREDKGYTYGISSNVVTHQGEGYFVIGSDVKGEFADQTIEEIYKEIKKLKTEKVDANELESVRNFMLGSFTNSITTPFSVADKFKTIHLNGLGYSFYKNYFESVRKMTPEIIINTANKYLDEDYLFEVVAGEKK